MAPPATGVAGGAIRFLINDIRPASLALAIALAAAAGPAAAADVENGKKVYLQRCAQCHGTEGTPFVKDPEDPGNPKKTEDGRPVLDPQAAPGAPFVIPRPRDFTRGAFKIRTTPSGEVPTDEDLLGVISNGMPGSSMPAWKGALTDSQIRDVAAYVKTFSEKFASEKPSKTLTFGGAVKPSKDSLEKGRAIYVEMACNSCHGEQGRGDGPSAPDLQDEWGSPIRPANFTMPWTLRGGPAREDIFRAFMTGLNGTPMPGYWDQFDGKEGLEKAWHLANYVSSLGEGRPNFQPVLRARFREALPQDPADPAWAEAPPVDFPLAGQVVAEPRQFTPSIERVSARAFYNGSELALLVEWDDRTRDDGDAFEIELPRRFKPAAGESTETEKPYFLHGGIQRPVELWRFEAKGGSLRSLTAKGPKSVPEPIESAGVFVSSAAYADGLWRLAIRRTLEPAETAGVSLKPGWFVPIAFFAWDGTNGDQGLKCSISTWYTLLLEPPTPKTAYAFPLLALLAAAALEFWWSRQSPS